MDNLLHNYAPSEESIPSKKEVFVLNKLKGNDKDESNVESTNVDDSSTYISDDEECEQSDDSESYYDESESHQYKKPKKNKKKKASNFSLSYINIIIIVIVFTLIFIVFASPTFSNWLSHYVPDPYFRLFTQALLFSIIIFIFIVLFSYDDKKYKKKHNK